MNQKPAREMGKVNGSGYADFRSEKEDMREAKFDVICHCPQVGVCGLHCKRCWVTDILKQNKPLDEVKKMIDGIAELREDPALTDATINDSKVDFFLIP